MSYEALCHRIKLIEALEINFVLPDNAKVENKQRCIPLLAAFAAA